MCIIVCAKMAESNSGKRYSKRMVLEFFPLEWKHLFGDGRMERSGFVVILSQCK